jgi:hypothetical protein
MPCAWEACSKLAVSDANTMSPIQIWFTSKTQSLTLELEVAHRLEYNLERKYRGRAVDFNILFWDDVDE